MDKEKSADQRLLQEVPAGSADPHAVPPNRLYAINNFDLIRLLAALQVSFHHLLEQLKVEPSGIIVSGIYKITVLFPGVPIFFFISGFLISKSYENNPRLRSYAKNRILRIYPALILCVTLSIISVFFSGYFGAIEIPIAKFIFWVLSQITIPGFYNPDFMRGYGSGVLDGPVWTISVELQLYILIPIVYKLVIGFKKDFNRIIIILIIIFSIISYTYALFYNAFNKEIWFKFIGISFLPWFYMFLLGVFFQINFTRMYKYLNNKLFYILGIFILIYYPLHVWFEIRGGNTINPLIFILLATFIFSFAYSYKNISNKLIKHNDISYGIYLYHMPVCNWFINMGWLYNIVFVLLSMLLASMISCLSWIFVEKPSLLLKKYSINPINWKYRLTGS